MDGAPPRLCHIEMQPGDMPTAPSGGPRSLRQAIADHYNRLYREKRASKYGPDNVSVGAGGRLLLSRVFACLAAGKVGYQVPDYTAYQDYFDYNAGRIEPVLIPTSVENGFGLPAADFDAAVAEQGLAAYLVSNPCNPTGRVIAGDELKAYVSTARTRDCTLILDEFYSHFIYDREGNRGVGPVSAATHVDDVNADPVLIVDGLTKSFRYPGWRVGWVVGTVPVIEVINRRQAPSTEAGAAHSESGTRGPPARARRSGDPGAAAGLRAQAQPDGGALAALGFGPGLAWRAPDRGVGFRRHPDGPLTYAMVTAVLIGVGLAACAIPAWRATRVDPLQALRAD